MEGAGVRRYLEEALIILQSEMSEIPAWSVVPVPGVQTSRCHSLGLTTTQLSSSETLSLHSHWSRTVQILCSDWLTDILRHYYVLESVATSESGVERSEVWLS